ncbi:MAG: hypothetical protein AB1758_21280 [Candidatus Eremiobacterota bacterium]
MSPTSEKLRKIQGLLLADIEGFPHVPYWQVPVEVVQQWWDHGSLGKTTRVSRAGTLSLLYIL